MGSAIASCAGPALLDPGVWRSASESLASVEQQLLSSAGSEAPTAAIARLETRGEHNADFRRKAARVCGIMPGMLAAFRAKGVPERTVFLKHALRNALIPTVTIVGLQLGTLLGGTFIIEKSPVATRCPSSSVTRHSTTMS